MTLVDEPKNTPPTSISVFQHVALHDFRPGSEESFTKDRRLLTVGIADLSDNDWQVRLLAVRDLVIAGAGALEDIVKGLDADDIHWCQQPDFSVTSPLTNFARTHTTLWGQATS